MTRNSSQVNISEIQEYLSKGSFENSITGYVSVETWLAICYFGVIGLFGLFANLTVIIVFIGTTRRKMSPSFGYILNMAATDVFMLLHLPLTIARHYKNTFIFGENLCRSDMAIKNVHLFVMLGTTTLMAVDRYLAVISHNSVPKRLKKARKNPKMVVFLCSLTWLISVLAIIPVFRRTIFSQSVVNNTITSSECYIDWSEKGNIECSLINQNSSSSYLLSDESGFHECNCQSTQPYSDFITCLFIFGYLLPIICFLLSYGSLLSKIVKSQRNLAGHSKSGLGSSSRTINRRSVFMISSLMLGLVVCYTPFHIYHMMRIWNVPLSRNNCERFKATVDALIWLLPAINPLFYSFFASEFQTRFKILSTDILSQRWLAGVRNLRSSRRKLFDPANQSCLNINRAIEEEQTSNLSRTKQTQIVTEIVSDSPCKI